MCRIIKQKIFYKDINNLCKYEKINEDVNRIDYSVIHTNEDKEKHKMFLAIRKDLQPNYASLVYVQSDGLEDNIHYLFNC